MASSDASIPESPLPLTEQTRKAIRPSLRPSQTMKSVLSASSSRGSTADFNFSTYGESTPSTPPSPLSLASRNRASMPLVDESFLKNFGKGELDVQKSAVDAHPRDPDELSRRDPASENAPQDHQRIRQYFDPEEPGEEEELSAQDLAVDPEGLSYQLDSTGGEHQLTIPTQLQLRKADVVRTWRGPLRVPNTKEGDEARVEDDYGSQTAVPVAMLPSLPADRIEPMMESQPPQRIQHQGGPLDESRPLIFETVQMPAKARLVDTDGSLRRQGRRKILIQKHLMQASQIGINGLLIFATWWWMHWWFIIVPLIMATVALNVVMIFSLIVRRTWNAISPEKTVKPEEPETLVYLVPTYNEKPEELRRSLDSLVTQRGVEDHKKALVIICDGKVRGKGMKKTTADHLIQDILTHKSERKYIAGAYTAWDQKPMNVVIQRGSYQGLPYICIVKQQNQGKRDGLIIARSFLYNFNRRAERPSTIFNPLFFDQWASFLIQDAGIENVVHLVGMDADTVFHEDCVYEILQQSRYPKTMGVCGYVDVDWTGGSWDLWRLYQSAEYTIAQALRRLHQSMVTHKVSCLPGCCQMLRVCEETCGDKVLLDLFGYCPDLTDGLLKNIRATASEDRNHVCHLLTARPQSQTRQALRAKSFTEVPRSWSVFLSQRRRWTLGATSNDLLLFTTRGTQWFERILAFVNVFTWYLNPFIFASLASFIFAFVVVAPWIVLCFVAVMLIPITYYLAIPIWLCKGVKPRVQFYLGVFIYIFGGPFLNIIILIYATVFMDSFGWGKTRKIVVEPTVETTEGELERLERGDTASEYEMEKQRRTSDGQAPAVDMRIWSEGDAGKMSVDDEERNLGR